MLVANSFDLWQKDAFFSAAEEVQQSADIMESAYRSWLKAKKEGLKSLYLDELSRELQMALGTAKWQLEEFEKAVTLSYRNSGDEVARSRYQQFVSAIEDQISRVETALKDSLDAEGKKPFRWVHLDKEECDDLAHFLSGSPSQFAKDEDTDLSSVLSTKDNNTSDYSSSGSKASSKMHQGKSLKVFARNESRMSCFSNLEEIKLENTGDDVTYQAGQFTGNESTLEIVIDKDDRQGNVVTETTPKEKGSKSFMWASRGHHLPRSRALLSHIQFNIINWMNLLRGGGHRSLRQQQQVSTVFPVNSIRLILILMLTIFLVVPFMVYAT